MTERVYNGYPVVAQQKCLAHLERTILKVVSLSHGNNSVLGQVFLDLIDEAFRQHRYGVTTQDAIAYSTWASKFKLRITQSIEQWIGRAGDSGVSYCEPERGVRWGIATRVRLTVVVLSRATRKCHKTLRGCMKSMNGYTSRLTMSRTIAA